MFEAAFDARLPIMLKGPTGCGKTRFVEYMAYHLKRPLITVACHEDLFASDLLGRYLLKKDETVWVDGPLTQAVRMGAIGFGNSLFGFDYDVALYSVSFATQIRFRHY